MADVTRIDQVSRRPAGERARRTPARRPDRVVELPLHRNADRVVWSAARKKRVTAQVVTGQGLTERELATRFFPVAFAVAAVDLATKAWAVTALAERTVALGPWLSLSLAFNRASAGGVSLGEHTRAINFTATGIVIGLVVMLVPALTRVDRGAWRALALIVGAGLGNLASLLDGARGVPDFLAVRIGEGGWVLNVADVALFVGLGMLAQTVVTLARTAWGRSGRATAPAR